MAADRTRAAAAPASFAVWPMSPALTETSWALDAVFCMLWTILAVAELCCSTAEAIPAVMQVTSSIVLEMSLIAWTASAVALWISPIWTPMPLVASAVWRAIEVWFSSVW